MYTKTVVNSYQVMDMIGDLGGILECMSIVMAVIATTHSNIMFTRDIVETNFKAKVPKE